MTAQPAALPRSPAGSHRDRAIERWRRRSRVIRVMRVVTPGLIILILIGLAGSIAYNALKPSPEAVQETNQPIRLIKPHFQGRDDRGRAFVITAVTATRDPQEYSKVYLDHPALVLDEQGPDPTRISANSGIFHEDTAILEAKGNVQMVFSRASFLTEASVFNTKTGELAGSSPIQGTGGLGEIHASSYAVHDKGENIDFHGRVHSVMAPKKK